MQLAPTKEIMTRNYSRSTYAFDRNREVDIGHAQYSSISQKAESEQPSRATAGTSFRVRTA